MWCRSRTTTPMNLVTEISRKRPNECRKARKLIQRYLRPQYQPTNQLNKQTAIQQSSKGKDGRTDINDHNRHPLSSSSSGGNIIGLYHLRLNIIRNIVGKNKKEIIENMRRQGLFSSKFSKISVKNYEIELKWNSRGTSLTHNLCLMSSIEFGKIL